MLSIIDTCLANSRASGTDLLVLIVLARGSNSRGYTRPLVRVVADLCGRSEQTIRESMEQLSTMGEIARVEQGGGKGKPTTWQIMVKREYSLPDLNIPEPDHKWETSIP